MAGEDKVTDYLKQREALISKDRSLRKDAALNASLTPVQRQADHKLRALRKWEIDNLWKTDGDKSSGLDELSDLFPGMGFLTARQRIEKSRLYSVLQKMPKGALLHCHFGATVDMPKLMELALDNPLMYVRISSLFSPNIKDVDGHHTLELPTPVFKVLKAGTEGISGASSLFEPGYNIEEFIPMRQARDNFPSRLGGQKGFDRWLYKSLTIDTFEAYQTHSTVTKIWQKFGGVFMVSAGIIFNEPVFRQYIKETMYSAIEDKLSWVEYRILFLTRTMCDRDGNDILNHKDWVRMFRESVDEVKEEMRQKGRADEFSGAKLIYTTMRRSGVEEIEWSLKDCIALKQAYPDVIAGYDLVGPEDHGLPLIHYLEPLLRFEQMQKEAGVDIPFIFHAGECLGDGNETDSNLYDAILLGTKRIGHGFSIVKHPHLMDLCKERNITLEMCPISNEVLRLTSTMPMHPIGTLLNHGVPVTINSDDPAIWQSTGISHDYYQVMISSEVSGLMTLYEIAKRSLEVSFIDEAQKVQAIKNWERHWDAFVEEVAALKLDFLSDS